MPEEVQSVKSGARQPTPSANIYPRLHSGSLHQSRPASSGGSRVTSASSRRTLSRTGSCRRPRSRKHGDRSVITTTTDNKDEAKDNESTDVDGVDIYNDYGWDTDLEAEPTTRDEHNDAADGRSSSTKSVDPSLQIYLDACKRNGVIPATYFLRHASDEHISMKHHCLGPLRVKPLATALASSAAVLSLDLEDNSLEEDGGVVLCRMLKENCYISELDLSNNKLGPLFAKCFADVVLSNSTLTNVTLAGNYLDDNAAPFLAEAIAGSGAIEYLDLSKNKLGEGAGGVLGLALAENASIKYLNLSFNSIRRRGATALGNGLKSNECLKILDLSWNGLGKEGSNSLGNALKVNTTLEELDIENNGINADAAVQLGKGLTVNESLKILKIGKNPLQSQGCVNICSEILKNNNTGLRRLDLNIILHLTRRSFSGDLLIKCKTDLKLNKRKFTNKLPECFVGLRQGLRIDEETRKLISNLTEKFSDLTIATSPGFSRNSCSGGDGRRGGGRPVTRLRVYLKQSGVDAVELFTGGRKFGGKSTPPRTVIDKTEFCDIVKSLEQLTFSDKDLEELVDALGVKGRDLVDYSELISPERPVSHHPVSRTAARPTSSKAAAISNPATAAAVNIANDTAAIKPDESAKYRTESEMDDLRPESGSEELQREITRSSGSSKTKSGEARSRQSTSRLSDFRQGDNQNVDDNDDNVVDNDDDMNEEQKDDDENDADVEEN